jgi:hypothetical protein
LGEHDVAAAGTGVGDKEVGLGGGFDGSEAELFGEFDGGTGGEGEDFLDEVGGFGSGNKDTVAAAQDIDDVEVGRELAAGDDGGGCDEKSFGDDGEG